jgi:hypothetical protein
VYWHAFQGCHTTFIGTDFEESAGHVFLRENPYSPYGPAQKSRVVLSINSGHDFCGYWHGFQGIVLLGLSVQSWQNFGTNSRQSVQHSLLVQPYSVWISGTEIEELHRTVQKESLLSKKAEISLCYFSEDEYAVKEFLRSP